MLIKPMRIFMLGVFLILSGCAYHQKIPFEKTKTLYQGQDVNDPLVLRQTPMLLTHNSASIYNRIGRPSARIDDQGEEQIYGDRKETGNPFYTSLIPWNREASDMWYFATFLKFWGCRL